MHVSFERCQTKYYMFCEAVSIFKSKWYYFHWWVMRLTCVKFKLPYDVFRVFYYIIFKNITIKQKSKINILKVFMNQIFFAV